MDINVNKTYPENFFKSECTESSLVLPFCLGFSIVIHCPFINTHLVTAFYFLYSLTGIFLLRYTLFKEEKLKVHFGAPIESNRL